MSRCVSIAPFDTPVSVPPVYCRKRPGSACSQGRRRECEFSPRPGPASANRRTSTGTGKCSPGANLPCARCRTTLVEPIHGALSATTSNRRTGGVTSTFANLRVARSLPAAVLAPKFFSRIQRSPAPPSLSSFETRALARWLQRMGVHDHESTRAASRPEPSQSGYWTRIRQPQ